jgi:hypothetical protein
MLQEEVLYMFTQSRYGVQKNSEVHFPNTSVCEPHNMFQLLKTHSFNKISQVPHFIQEMRVSVLCVIALSGVSSPHLHIHALFGIAPPFSLRHSIVDA